MNNNTNGTSNSTHQPNRTHRPSPTTHLHPPEQTAPTEPKTFTTIDGNTLMAQQYEPLQFAIEKILPHGLFIFAGSGKIGKSWLILDGAVAVATGNKLWDFSTEQGKVLYLALEDNYPRLQGRLTQMESDGTDISRLYLATASLGISTGMIEQTLNFLQTHPDTNLIIVDTLQCIRDTDCDSSMYSYDYKDMTALREITNQHKVTLMLIHHTRKMHDPDPLNMLSGSTGLVGAVDGVWVLEKEKRTSKKAKLTIANRDTEDYCFKLEFDGDKGRWLFIGSAADVEEDENEWFCLLVDDFLQQDAWSGTATELCDALKKIDPDADITKLNIKKQLKGCAALLKKEFAIGVDFDRSNKSRAIYLTRQGA